MPIARAPFLLLSIRAEPDAAADECQAVLRCTGLAPAQLRYHNLTETALPPIDLTRYSGIILGGGPYNSSDSPAEKSPAQVRTEAALASMLTAILAADFPFLGCCYGIGALGTAIGATIDRQYSEPVAGVEITLTEAGQHDPLFAGVPRSFGAYAGHKEAASALPAHAVVLASSAACPVQAFRVGANVYATQFHPELDAAGICTRIDVYKSHGYFAPSAAEELKAAARRWDVTHPATVLRNFADRYAREQAPAQASA